MPTLALGPSGAPGRERQEMGAASPPSGTRGLSPRLLKDLRQGSDVMFGLRGVTVGVMRSWRGARMHRDPGAAKPPRGMRGRRD